MGCGLHGQRVGTARAHVWCGRRHVGVARLAAPPLLLALQEESAMNFEEMTRQLAERERNKKWWQL